MKESLKIRCSSQNNPLCDPIQKYLNQINPIKTHILKRNFIIPPAMFSSNMCSTPFIISDENVSEFIASTKRSVRPAHRTTICLWIKN